MSNAEMPPLACGQVWVNGSDVMLVGDIDWHGRRRVAYAWEDILSSITGETEHDVVKELTEDKSRLIYGPGAPWSPAEEVPHA